MHHRIVLGLALIGVGVVGVVASLEGTLPAVIAALFDPAILTTNGSAPGINPNSVGGRILQQNPGIVTSIPTQPTGPSVPSSTPVVNA